MRIRRKCQETAASASTRLVTTRDAEEVRDLHAGGPVGEVKRLRFALKVFRETELDQLGEYELIPLAQLERFGAEIRFSEDYIPPCLSSRASPSLKKLVEEIRDQVTARGYQLEEHKSKGGIQCAEFGTRDMVYFLALRSVNRYLRGPNPAMRAGRHRPLYCLCPTYGSRSR